MSDRSRSHRPETGEEPFRMRGRAGLAILKFKNEAGHLPAFQIIEQSSPEVVLRRVNHGLDYRGLAPAAVWPRSWP